MKPEIIQAGAVVHARIPSLALCCALFASAWLAGCALPPPVREYVMVPVNVPAPPAPPPVAAPALPPPASKTVLDYAEQLAALPSAELPREIGRLGDPGDSPVRQMQLALALGMTGLPSDLMRAQQLLNRVAENPGVDTSLRPLARLLATQYASQRRADEQIERQNLQLRDAQRRVDQLSDRLEAMRAIERSLPARRPGPAVSSGEQRPPTP